MKYKNKQVDFTYLLSSIIYALEQNLQILNTLDQIIGDADHGDNILNFWKCLNIKYLELNLKDVDKNNIVIFFKSLSSLSDFCVNGSASQIVCMLIHKIANYLSNDSLEDLIFSFDKAVKNISLELNICTNSKTMFDVLIPLANYLKENKQIDLNTLDEKLYHFADSTKNMIAKKGRAAFFGNKSIGVVDPGAFSITIVIKAFIDCFKN